jgi:hypothetical protein
MEGMTSRLAFLLVLLTALLAGCGGGSSEESEGAASGQECSAAPAAMPKQPQLTTGFPSPSEVTYTEERDIGPSHIVEGYWDGDIESAYEGYKDAFEGTDYSVTKDEREEVDAEVNFAGQGVSGQVKLLQLCKDRTDVTITTRPA